MNKLFLVNYTPKPHLTYQWECFRMTHSLSRALSYAKELRKMGHDAAVQSVLINKNGGIKCS